LAPRWHTGDVNLLPDEYQKPDGDPQRPNGSELLKQGGISYPLGSRPPVSVAGEFELGSSIRRTIAAIRGRQRFSVSSGPSFQWRSVRSRFTWTSRRWCIKLAGRFNGSFSSVLRDRVRVLGTRIFRTCVSLQAHGTCRFPFGLFSSDRSSNLPNYPFFLPG